MDHLPYCGAPPTAETLLGRWNLDPILIAALLIAVMLHLRGAASSQRKLVLMGWATAALAYISPLCALSVSLFAARVAQHMILLLIAAPLIGASRPARPSGRLLWPSAVIFFVALWFWHMPVPYDATFGSTPIYWAMHVSLFGSAIWLWRELIGHPAALGLQALMVGTLTSLQMSLLGAVLTLASHPMFIWHFGTTEAWGFTPLADQQLGGVLMWVPGCVLFLWVTVRSAQLFASAVSEPKTA